MNRKFGEYEKSGEKFKQNQNTSTQYGKKIYESNSSSSNQHGYIENIVKEAEQRKKNEIFVTMRYSIKKATLEITKKTSKGISFSVNYATSGSKKAGYMGDVTKQNTKFGPIPAGVYYILPKELDDPISLLDPYRKIRRGDWGDFRIRIHPTFFNLGRDNFFIHGGSAEGSAGCIDVGGGIFGDKESDKVKDAISSTNNEIYLIVVED